MSTSTGRAGIGAERRGHARRRTGMVAVDGEPVRRRWSRRGVMRAARFGAVATALAVAVAVAVVVAVGDAPPSRAELLERAQLVGKRELLIGVKDDQPGVSERDPGTRQFTGFDIDVAYLVAAELGFRRSEVRFLAIESEDRARMQARTESGEYVTVDLVVASYSVTEERERQPRVSFSAPYLRTEQSVVTRRDHPPVQTLADLRDRPVCTITTSTSGSAAERAGTRLRSKNRISECMTGLRAGEFDAVTTDAAILAGFVAADPQALRIHDVGLEAEEAWGINTGGNEALRQLVNLALYGSLHDPRDQRWEEAFDRHLRPKQQFNDPQPVAVASQPDVPKVEVRRWPWERGALAARP
jgi:glutamate transport system substrate-binding protein